MSSSTDVTLEGGCICGAIRYRVCGEPRVVTHCHCTHCRVAHAAPYVTWATFDTADVAFTGDSPGRYSTRPKVVRTFCTSCGTQLTYHNEDEPETLDLTVCTLDDPEALKPADHVWSDRMLSWVRPGDGLPRFAKRRDDLEVSPGTLFLVDGPSGAGKSHLLRYAEGTHGAIALPKYTTRPPSPDSARDEWSDLVHVSETAFREAPLDFRYERTGHAYGFSRADVERAVESGAACFVVVRDVATIRRVRDELAGIRVVPLWVEATAAVLRSRLGDVGHGVADPVDEEHPDGHADPYVESIANDSSISDFHDNIDDLIVRRTRPGGDET